MYNWSIDEEKLKKDKQKYAIWKLEQMVNFGLGDGKIQENELRNHWDEINIDPARKKYLSLLLDD
jgi:hypothetical protein